MVHLMIFHLSHLFLLSGVYQNHLNHMELGLKNALNKLSKEFTIKFVYICQNNKEWKQGKPNIKMEFKNCRKLHFCKIRLM